ncbi:MAG TPA: polysaccharide deacetylase family protein [Pirellulaceae bacterium]|nr:polysaccharide deacetylase family protein [Pirellulaceae bacterium]
MTTFLSPWKGPLIGAYYYATLPGRWWLSAAAARDGHAPVMVIYYHRVADYTPNDWTISNARFNSEIDWLQANFDLVSLDEAQRRIREGNTRASVTITFDDGYAENCERALPLLIGRRIPCTYFVTSYYALTGKSFPHDVAAGTPLRPNTIAQLRALAAAGIEIGGHTRTHADLGQITCERQLRDEIVGGREDLEQALGIEIRHFAFPYGLHENLQAAAFHIAAGAGFAGVCSAYGGYNLPGDDPFHLQRIHADPQIVRLKNWLTIDPRNIRATARFNYKQPPPESCVNPPPIERRDDSDLPPHSRT